MLIASGRSALDAELEPRYVYPPRGPAQDQLPPLPALPTPEALPLASNPNSYPNPNLNPNPNPDPSPNPDPNPNQALPLSSLGVEGAADRLVMIWDFFNSMSFALKVRPLGLLTYPDPDPDPDPNPDPYPNPNRRRCCRTSEP